MIQLSEAVRRLIAEHVDTLEKLEVLALICRTNSSSPRASGSYPRLSGSQDAVRELVSSGVLIEATRGYKVSDAHRIAVDALLTLYEDDPSSLFVHLTQQAIGRIRRSMTDAFDRPRRARGDRNDRGND